MLHKLIEIHGRSADEPLVVLTRSWSSSADPVERETWLHDLVPATYLLSATTDPEDEADDESTWQHTYASPLRVLDSPLTSLLLLVADDKTAEVAIMPSTADWVYSPYPGGMDIRGVSETALAGLSAAFSDWLPIERSGADARRHLDVQTDVPGWEFRSYYMSRFAAHRLAQVAEDEELLVSFGRIIDPRSELTFDLDREEALFLSAVLSNRSVGVLDTDRGALADVTPDEARARLAERKAADIDDFLNLYGYRAPDEAINGALPGRFRDPQQNYRNIRDEELP